MYKSHSIVFILFSCLSTLHLQNFAIAQDSLPTTEIAANITSIESAIQRYEAEHPGKTLTIGNII